MDTKIIISGLLDNNVLQMFPNLSITLYEKVSQLYDDIEAGPVVTETLYISEDIIKYNPNTVFSQLVKVFESPFFKCEETIFAVAPSSDMLERIEFLNKNNRLGNVTVLQGEVTKEFLLNIIRGGASSSKTKHKRKAVMRHRKDEFIQQSRTKSQFTETDYVDTEQDRLSVIGPQENVEREQVHIQETDTVCELIQITGINKLTTSTFAVILSQFISGYGKVVLFETDTYYVTTSYLVTQSKMKCLNIPMADFYRNPLEVVNKIRDTDHNIICITSSSSYKDQNFRPYSIIHTLYNMLKNNVSYFIIPSIMTELLTSMRTIVVMDNDLLSLIETAHTVPTTSIQNMQFVAIHTRKDYCAIQDSNVIASILYEITNIIVEVPIYDIQSLNLEGGDIYDLYRYVEGSAKASASV